MIRPFCLLCALALPVAAHATEETYVILEGRGTMTFASGKREVAKGDFVYLPPWCEHGIENTGTESLVVLIATSPKVASQSSDSTTRSARANGPTPRRWPTKSLCGSGWCCRR